ncbi:MAG: diaminopimelate decarboxylase family protein [Candidatus Carsonella ruddii]
MKEFKKNVLINNVKLIELLKKFNIPIYLYNYKKIIYNIYIIKKLNFYCFYSIKSNDNLYILKIVNLIIKKFDIVSIGELKKIILISKKKPYIIFSGSGKNITELIISIKLNIFCINIESVQEYFKIYFLIKNYKKKINIMIRINPNIDAKTHKKISTGKYNNKFGISILNLKNIFLIYKITNLFFFGIDFHIGSQITKISPIKKLLYLINILLKINNFNYIDIGGGIGVNYYDKKNIITLSNYYNNIFFLLKKKKIKFFLEIGRFFFANTCIIFSKVNYLKFNILNNLSIINIGINDNIRPALYSSFHKIESLNKGKKFKNIFGVTCESSDKFINYNKIKLKNNSIIIIYSCGSYCKVLSNNYNSKKKSFEIIIYKNKLKLIFKKEIIKNLINNYD